MTTATHPIPVSPTLPTLNIDGFRFSELHVAPKTADDAAPPSAAPLLDYDLFSHPEDRRRFAVALRIVAWVDAPETPDAAPVRQEVRVSAIGFLTSSEELPDDLPFIVAVNGLALLYGIIRGALTTVGAWFGAQSILPTVNFSRLVRERTERAAEASHPPKKRRRKTVEAATTVK